MEHENKFKILMLIIMDIILINLAYMISFYIRLGSIYNELYKCLNENINTNFLRPMSNVKVQWKCGRCGKILRRGAAYHHTGYESQ